MFKRFTTHTLMALAEASLIALLVVGLIAGTALAGKGGKHVTASLECSVAPDPVTVGSIYTVSGSGYPTGRQIVVEVTNAHGTVVLFTGAEADGQISASSYASWAEGHSVKVFDNSRRRPALLAECSFSAT